MRKGWGIVRHHGWWGEEGEVEEGVRGDGVCCEGEGKVRGYQSGELWGKRVGMVGW